MGAFAVAIAVEQATGSEAIERYDGLSARAPFLAIAMAIFLLSLAGIPPLAGFFGKFYVFSIAIKNPDFIWLAVVGVINSVIAVYYYMNVVRRMYFRSAPDLGTEDVKPSAVAGVSSAIVIALVGTLALGIWPGPLVRFLSDSIFPGGLS
jgi:NADH-quinone oxidoreductase subunit N